MNWKPTTIQILGLICIIEMIVTQTPPITGWLIVGYGIGKFIMKIDE